MLIGERKRRESLLSKIVVIARKGEVRLRNGRSKCRPITAMRLRESGGYRAK